MRSTIAAVVLTAFLTSLAAGDCIAGDKEKGEAKSDAKATIEAQEKEKLKEKDEDTTVELQLIGVVQSEVRTKEGKEGKDYTRTVYFLTTNEEKVALPDTIGEKSKEGASAQLKDFVDKEVEMRARGWVKKDKEGNEKTAVQRIISMNVRTVR